MLHGATDRIVRLFGSAPEGCESSVSPSSVEEPHEWRAGEEGQTTGYALLSSRRTPATGSSTLVGMTEVGCDLLCVPGYARGSYRRRSAWSSGYTTPTCELASSGPAAVPMRRWSLATRI